jgi:FkbM family methyltransferase
MRLVLGPTQRLRDPRKLLAPAAALQKARSRIDWLRFGRSIRTRPWPGLVRLGSPYGGYVVPLDLFDPGWVCYSGGLGEDISFELELIDAVGCRVYGFDPVPRAAETAQAVAEVNPLFEFLPVGLWSTDTTARFYAPADRTHVSHSIVNLQRTHTYITAPCRSLTSLMGDLGHDRIDLLKLDVEGAEYEVLKPVVAGDVDVKVLCVDFHKVESLEHMKRFVERLTERGYQPAHVHRTDVTLIRA